MYQVPYSEIIGENPADARANERQALEKAIELLKLAEEKGARSRESTESLLYVQRLWSFLIEDLANSENKLPPELRASLISIGIWVLREVENIRLERSRNFKGLIEITEIVCKGLN